MGRKIKMLKSVRGAPEHVTTYAYLKDMVYEVGSANTEELPPDAPEGTVAATHPLNERLATAFVKNGDAEEVKSTKIMPPSSETKG